MGGRYSALRILYAWMLLAMPVMALSEEEQKTFFEEVLFRRTFIAGNGEIIRWERSPTVSVMTGTEAEKARIERALRSLERPLRPAGFRMRRLADGEGSADIRIYHGGFGDLARIGAEAGLPGVLWQLDQAHPFFDAEGRLEKMVVILDNSVAAAEGELQRRAVKLVLAAIGLGGETRIRVKSVFFEEPPFGAAEELPSAPTALDVRLMRLLYAYLEAGLTPEQAAEVMRQNWSKIL